MTARHLLIAACMALSAPALAQSTLPEIPPVSPTAPGDTGTPIFVTPAPMTAPIPTKPSTPPALSKLPDVNLNLFVPRTVTGKLNLNLTVRNARTTPISFGLARQNDQDCAFAPLVRVLRVGTREVVYPRAGTRAPLCTQEMQSKTAPAKGMVSFTRTLNLPAGDYVIESWLSGFADGTPVKLSASPMRVTVK